MTAEIEAAFAASATIGRPPPARTYASADADRMTRFIKPAPQVLAVPASGIITFDMDGPKTGYQWTVRRIWVSDAAALSSTCAGLCGIYAGQPTPGLVTPANGEWIMPTLPNASNFGSDELVLQYGEHLLVQVTGATVGQNIICSIAYQLYLPGNVSQQQQV
jgi:hypothetical protein